MKEQLPADDISKYELRMHEADGEPEDFSIDRHALITTFGDDEFCICYNSEARTSHADTVDEAEEEDFRLTGDGGGEEGWQAPFPACCGGRSGGGA